MKITHILPACLRPVLFVALAALFAGAQARSEFDGVTAIVVTPASGSLSARADEPAGVRILMQEINAERRRQWLPFRGKLSTCAVRLTLYKQDSRVARLVLDGNEFIEFASASDSSGYSREVARGELTAVRRLAGKVKSPGSCPK
jgi:hypothetical protein